MKVMWALVLGMVISFMFPLKEKVAKINGRLQQFGVVFLLFFMGASIGADDKIIENISTIGIKAIVFSILSCLGSIIVVYFLTEKIKFKKDKKVSYRGE